MKVAPGLVMALLPAAVLARPGTVLATFQPLYSMAATILAGSPRLAAVCPAPGPQGPHEFDPEAPEHAARLDALARRAVALVDLRSLRLAPRFDRLYPWARARRIRIVELDPAWDWERRAPAFPLLANPGAGSGSNPHVWLAPSLGAELVRRLAAELGALDPPRAGAYAKRGEAMARRLLALRAAALARLAAADRLEVVALTEGFPYLTTDLGIRVVDYVLDEAEPGAIAARVRRADVRVVLAEEPPPAAVRAAVEAAGARVLVLDTLEHGFGGGAEVPVDGYERGLASDLDELVGALTARGAGRP